MTDQIAGTYVTLTRQLRKIQRELDALRESGAILSADYSELTREGHTKILQLALLELEGAEE
jgi:ribosomal protein L19E